MTEMKYEELKASIAIWDKSLASQGVHAEQILAAAKAQLAQMKDDVWIPPKGMIVESYLQHLDVWIPFTSSGVLDKNDRLISIDEDRYTDWRPIPNLLQFTKHDLQGSNWDGRNPEETVPLLMDFYKAGLAEGKKGERREGMLIAAKLVEDKQYIWCASEIRTAADELEGKE